MNDQPATHLLIARHGDAEYPSAGGLLHGVMTMESGRLTATGRDQVAAMAEALVGTGVAHVYSSHLTRARESAQIVAARLGVETSAVGGLQEYEVGELDGAPYADPRAQAVFAAWLAGDLTAGFPGGETGQHIVERLRDATQDIAAAHPAERVVVISHGGVMSLAIPRLSPNVRDDLARRQYLPNAVPAEVAIDGDGMRVVSWPGSADKHAV